MEAFENGINFKSNHGSKHSANENCKQFKNRTNEAGLNGTFSQKSKGRDISLYSQRSGTTWPHVAEHTACSRNTQRKHSNMFTSNEANTWPGYK